MTTAERPGRTTTYIHLYYDLILRLRAENTWRSMFLIILTAIFWTAVLSVLIYYWQGSASFSDVLDALVILGVSIAVFAYTAFVAFSAWLNTRDPLKLATRLTAQMVATLRSPYRQQRGLTSGDVQQLQKVARIEQGAADWRGSFVNVIIIGTITAVFTVSRFVFPDEPTPSLNAPGSDATFIAAQDIIPEPVRNALGTLFLILLIGFTVASLFRYLRYFMATELVNRVILFACEETMSLMAFYNLADVPTLTIAQKQLLVRRVGYRIVKQPRPWSVAWNIADSFRDESGAVWYLEPISPWYPFSPPPKWLLRSAQVVVQRVGEWRGGKMVEQPDDDAGQQNEG